MPVREPPSTPPTLASTNRMRCGAMRERPTLGEASRTVKRHGDDGSANPARRLASAAGGRLTMATFPVRFGIQTGQQSVEWGQILDLWKKADAWGYDSVWAFDHFYPIFVDPEGPCLEGLTTLAALAQATTRARVGHLVLGNTYRHPAITAKAACTLDHISGGRFNLGIGAGWFALEHQTLGIDFKTVGGRLEALEEALRIIKGMFTQDQTTVHGRHYDVTDALCLPKPVQKPHPPIMIGGTGERVLLRIVAQYAEMWNAFAPAAEMKRLGDVIDRHGERVRS